MPGVLGDDPDPQFVGLGRQLRRHIGIGGPVSLKAGLERLLPIGHELSRAKLRDLFQLGPQGSAQFYEGCPDIAGIGGGIEVAGQSDHSLRTSFSL